jgi:hexokinase
MVPSLRGEVLGEWLPLALADILARLLTIWGGEVERSTILQSWGLEGAVETNAAKSDDPAGDEWLGFMIRAGATTNGNG